MPHMCPDCQSRTLIRTNDDGDRECTTCGYTCKGHSYVQIDICKNCGGLIELTFEADSEYTGGLIWKHKNGNHFCYSSTGAVPIGDMEIEDTKLYMNWQMFDRAITKIAADVALKFPNTKVIYGIPRNGLILAVAISHRLNIPIIQELRVRDGYELSEVLVVDDVSDTGKTLGKYVGIPTATLYFKPKTSKKKPDIYVYETDRLIVFPWETEESAKADYMEGG